MTASCELFRRSLPRGIIKFLFFRDGKENWKRARRRVEKFSRVAGIIENVAK